MKSNSWKLLTVLAFTTLLLSCASTPRTTSVTMQEASVTLQREQYVILGRITESATVIAATSALEREEKNLATGAKEINDTVLDGDNGNYGFIGTNIPSNLTIKEKAVALATYKLLELAKFNEADAVLYVTQNISVKQESTFRSRVTATVSALAVQVKADADAKLPAPPTPAAENVLTVGDESNHAEAAAGDSLRAPDSASQEELPQAETPAAETDVLDF